ncbi:MAG: hypothetical protein U9O87_09930, partial [Verrucomicrobiota bacterium]|nr:hypothetical protein [Verrucomicrobiota bacterium]
DKTLVFFYFHCKRLAFEIIPIYSDSNILNWPSFDSLIPDKSDLFLLLIALSAVPIIRKQHASMGVNS